MPRIVHFEIPADDPERVIKFYSQMFNWKVEKWAGPEDYWMVTTGPDSEPGINGAIMRRLEPQGQPINTVEVPSVDEYVKKVTTSGGKVAMPKMAIPGVGWAAYCTDPEGNKFGLFQNDPSAK